jgi:preprotein translocase SecE subunit
MPDKIPTRPILGTINLVQQMIDYIRSVKLELSQVRWPKHEKTLQLTILVILVSVIVALYSGGLDALFTTLLQQIVK